MTGAEAESATREGGLDTPAEAGHHEKLAEPQENESAGPATTPRAAHVPTAAASETASLPSPPSQAWSTVDRVSPVDLGSEESFNQDPSVHRTKSAPAEMANTRSMLRRAQNRAEELRKLFRLSAEEHFLDDFMCALKKRVLLQGRMYVFGAHVCFHCNLFGYQKTKCIPLTMVVDVRKKKNVGFPNSIEFTLEGGKREFFTSFLAREEAFRLIMAQWRQCSDHAPPTPEPEVVAESGTCPSGRTRSVSRLLRGMSSLVHRESGPKDACEPSRGRSSLAGGLEPLEEERAADDSGSGARSSFTGDSGAAGLGLVQDGSMALIQDNSIVAWPTTTAFHATASGGGPATPGAAPGYGGTAGGVDDEAAGEAAARAAVAAAAAAMAAKHSDGEGGSGELNYEFQALTDLQCQKELELDVAQNEAAPAMPKDMRHVLEFDLPCPPLEFWSRFLANHSDFLKKFHTSRGDTTIRLGQWQRHYKVGMVRDLQFVHPVKARIGPPQTMCHQTQRLQMFAKRHLVLETSQVMADIPYADHFSVETRWDVAPHKGGSRVDVHLNVPFCKKTMWQRFIEKGSYDDTLEMVQGWRQMACEKLAADPCTGLTPVGPEPHSEAEWNALLAQVAPQYRGAVQHLRRNSRPVSISQGGVHVGRQLPMLVRHRRNASRSEPMGGPQGRTGSGQSPLGPNSRPHSRGNSTRSLQLAEQEEAVKQQPAPSHLLEQGGPEKQQQQQQQQRLRGASNVPPLLLVALLALVIWLLMLLLTRAQALGSRQFVGWACCVALIAVQAAIIVQLRRQVAHLRLQLVNRNAASGPLPSAVAGTSGSSGWQGMPHVAAALGRDVAQLQQALQQLRVQLDSTLRTAADLGLRLQHTEAADGTPS